MFTTANFARTEKCLTHPNRWYDATVGKWLSEDPIGFGGNDVNLVRYVGNSPTDNVDPTGLYFVKRYSRGGDDPGRQYETARIDIYIEWKKNCKQCKGQCTGSIDFTLRYHVHLRGTFFAPPAPSYGIDNGKEWKALRGTIPQNQGPKNWALMNKEISIGSIPCDGNEMLRGCTGSAESGLWLVWVSGVKC